ncbi:MAG: PleD family two-component system response regulator [Xenococcaceae cyanobacterium]
MFDKYPLNPLYQFPVSVFGNYFSRKYCSIMKQLSTVSGAYKELHSINLLEQLSRSESDGFLQVSNGSVYWLIYFHQGNLTYASHSVDPFERLERHLRRLSHENPKITNEVRTIARLNFEIESPSNSTQIYSDYQAICWLVEQQYISSNEAANLVKRLTKEVLESYILLLDGTYNFIPKLDEFPMFCSLAIQPFVEECSQNLQAWKALEPKICSPDQRPYFFSQSRVQKKNLSPQKIEKLSRILRGFSFRQLAALLNQDELKLAQSLHPLIADGTIILRDPQPHFEQLPKLSNYSLDLLSSVTADLPNNLQTDIQLPGIEDNKITQEKSRICCVDDSPTMLKQINRFLEEHNLAVFTINDSVKALREIIRIKPDLILLDVGMPMVDGYKLCRLIRNHSLFKTTPIVMVTGNTSLIDRAKAKVAGATDYMTKPFTQSELLKMVFRYLT